MIVYHHLCFHLLILVKLSICSFAHAMTEKNLIKNKVKSARELVQWLKTVCHFNWASTTHVKPLRTTWNYRFLSSDPCGC